MENTLLKVFIIYAHEDKLVRDKLLRQLRPLASNGEISLWSDHEIMPGEVWDDAIRTRLTESDLILLLISDDFFASDYIQKVELDAALDRYKSGQTRLLPIIARHCGWEDFPVLAKLQVLPPEGRPVISKEWDSPDEPYHAIYQGIRAIVREMRAAAAGVLAMPLQQPVVPSMPRPVATMAAPRPPAAFDWRKPAIWALLVIVLGGVGYVAWTNAGGRKANTPDKSEQMSNKPVQNSPTQYSNPPGTPPQTSVVTDKPATATVKPATKPNTIIKGTTPPLQKVLPYDEKLGVAVEGMWRVKKGTRYGFLNVKTNNVIGWYQAAENFHDGQAYVKRDGYNFYIGKDGMEIKNPLIKD